jgi:hypothetical protein
MSSHNSKSLFNPQNFANNVSYSFNKPSKEDEKRNIEMMKTREEYTMRPRLGKYFVRSENAVARDTKGAFRAQHPHLYAPAPHDDHFFINQSKIMKDRYKHLDNTRNPRSWAEQYHREKYFEETEEKQKYLDVLRKKYEAEERERVLLREKEVKKDIIEKEKAQKREWDKWYDAHRDKYNLNSIVQRYSQKKSTNKRLNSNLSKNKNKEKAQKREWDKWYDAHRDKYNLNSIVQRYSQKKSTNKRLNSNLSKNKNQEKTIEKILNNEIEKLFNNQDKNEQSDKKLKKGPIFKRPTLKKGKYFKKNNSTNEMFLKNFMNFASDKKLKKEQNQKKVL